MARKTLIAAGGCGPRPAALNLLRSWGSPPPPPRSRGCGCEWCIAADRSGESAHAAAPSLANESVEFASVQGRELSLHELLRSTCRRERLNGIASMSRGGRVREQWG